MRLPTRSLRALAPALLAAASLSLLIPACGGNKQLRTTWKEPDAPPGPYRKVVAIALAQDEETRRIAEDEFARHLPRGTEGVASYQIVPKDEEGDVEKVVARLKSEGVDGAAIMRLVGQEQGVVYDPGSLSRPMYTFQSYYGTVWASWFDPGYLVNQTSVYVETAFFSVDSESRVWTGYSESIDPRSAKSVIDDVARFVVGELRKERLIQ